MQYVEVKYIESTQPPNSNIERLKIDFHRGLWKVVLTRGKDTTVTKSSPVFEIKSIERLSEIFGSDCLVKFYHGSDVSSKRPTNTIINR